MSLGVRSQIEFVGEQNCTRISRMFLKFSNECNLAPISTLFLNKVILILYGQSIESSKAILSNKTAITRAVCFLIRYHLE